MLADVKHILDMQQTNARVVFIHNVKFTWGLLGLLINFAGKCLRQIRFVKGKFSPKFVNIGNKVTVFILFDGMGVN